jgi:hypothetical protein
MSGGSIVSVTGGVGSIEARTDDLRLVSGILSRAARELDEDLRVAQFVARDAVGVLGEPMLRDAGTEPLDSLIDRTRATARVLSMAADSYEQSDWRTYFDFFVQHPGSGAFVGAARTVLSGVVYVDTLGRVPFKMDPRSVDFMIDFIPAPDAVRQVLADRYDDGRPKLAEGGVDLAPQAQLAPSSLRDVLLQLRHRDQQEAGAIDVRILGGPDDPAGGPRRVIVDIPGTTRWNLLGGGSVVTDWVTNVRAVSGLSTSYGEGTLAALRAAGVTADDQILLVGHSEGGIVASQLAQEVASSGEFTVTDVLTAGAPIGLIPILPTAGPPVHTLALENRNDPVPHADGRDNPDSPELVTVTVDTGATNLDAHSLKDGYLPAADAVTTSGDASVQAALERLQPYLDATTVTTYTYTVTRQ